MNPALRSTRSFAALLSLVVLTAASCNSGKSSYVTGPAGAKELNSGDLAPGATYQHRFAASGTFNYHCLYHSGMTGSVVVSADAPDTLVQIGITGMSFPGAPTQVKTGGRVAWTNNSDLLHTVTSN